MTPGAARDAGPPEPRELEVHRVLVALDATEDSLASLDLATRLAAKLRAEIEGLFVEDINLLRMADLPCTRVVSVATTSAQGLDLPSMERELRRQARVARDMLAMNAERFSVRWSFRTARGAMAGEVLAAASEADIVVVGKSDRAYPQRARLGATARTLSARSPTAVLIAHHSFVAAEYSPPGAILAAYDDTPTGDRALRLAARIAVSEKHPLTVLVPDSKRTAPRLEERANALSAAFGLQPRFRRIGRREAARLAAIVHAEHGELFVLGCESPLLRGKSTDAVVEDLDIPALLIRPGADGTDTDTVTDQAGDRE